MIVSNRLRRHFLITAMAVLCVAAGMFTARAQVINLDRPGDRDFVVDKAGLLTPEDLQAVRAICDTLLTERATPIVVVTIDSMTAHGGPNMRIETFATLLFNQWGIGYEKVGEREWNTGILLLVSMQDHSARIELGNTWGRDFDAVAARVMQEQIIPHFKEGKFSEGILAGVRGLDSMARGLQLPKAHVPPRPWWHYALVIGGVALAIFTVVSLIMSGAKGWAWVFWGIVFGTLGTVLFFLLSSRGYRGRGTLGGGFGGGGFSGGSFGGGFSGGGGATGSW
ncbi:MAG: TPM domain-containing protein [Candidatus Hydrogenedentes bacterium]|nr:TPM domain-containing protein [Candidatus Hydrogenedentota bacterium]